MAQDISLIFEYVVFSFSLISAEEHFLGIPMGHLDIFFEEVLLSSSLHFLMGLIDLYEIVLIFYKFKYYF